MALFLSRESNHVLRYNKIQTTLFAFSPEQWHIDVSVIHAQMTVVIIFISGVTQAPDSALKEARVTAKRTYRSWFPC